MDRCCFKPLLTILKTDKYTGKGLSGALFELTDSCGRCFKQTTPAHGLIRFQLAFCEKYKLREVLAPIGYTCKEREYKICVDGCGNIYVDGRCADFIMVENTPVIQSVSILYHANGGEGQHYEGDLPLNTNHTILRVEDTGITPPEGSIFMEWNTKKDGSGTKAMPGDVIVLSADTILYAIWGEDRTVTVTGLVFPKTIDDHGYGEDFLNGFDIVAELRESFLTPASGNLKTTVEILYDELNIGRFAFKNVSKGDYVLYIKLAGHLVRCMNVTITEDSPELTLLVPPGDETIFNLWPGDVNDDLVIDQVDINAIEALDGTSYGEPGYIFAADLNFDGIIDSADLALANANLNKTAADYRGGEDVDFNS